MRESQPEKEAFIIGGAQTYCAFSDYVDRYLITLVKDEFPEADAFFDRGILGNMSNWTQRELAVERVQDPQADEFEFSVVELRHKAPEEVAERRKHALANRECAALPAQPKKQSRSANEGAALDQLFSFA